ncbi:hypothetical protein F4779DRAFT_635121 [Xylariaceae sp. FL0662B]|nr:hypothetical protein F4779DRAFT_635121 [Xylariaceae sp. FL0662B]
MNGPTVAQPSAMAMAASSHLEKLEGRRFPVAVSSDNDSEGGAPLIPLSASGTDSGSVTTATNAVNNVATPNVITPSPRIASKLDANTAPFIPSGISTGAGTGIGAISDSTGVATSVEQINVQAQYQHNGAPITRPSHRTPPSQLTQPGPAATAGNLHRRAQQENSTVQPQNYETSAPAPGVANSHALQKQASPQNIAHLRHYLLKTTRSNQDPSSGSSQQQGPGMPMSYSSPTLNHTGNNGSFPTYTGPNVSNNHGLHMNLNSFGDSAQQAPMRSQLGSSSSYGLLSPPRIKPVAQQNGQQYAPGGDIYGNAGHGQAYRLTGSNSNGNFHDYAPRTQNLAGNHPHHHGYASSSGASRANGVGSGPRFYAQREQAANPFHPNGDDGNGNQAMAPHIPQGYRGGLTGSNSEGSLLAPRDDGYNYGTGYTNSRTLVPFQQGNGFSVHSAHSPATYYGPLYFAPVPLGIKQQRSELLNMLTQNAGPPTVQAILDSQFFPFIETCRLAKPADHGVVHLSNIPYDITRAEIVAYFGRNSKILNDCDEPVHIIMDRVNSKTMDCYVEFVTLQDALNAVKRHQDGIQHGRTARIGSRTAELELSSQAQLKKDLFPVAKGVDWNANPQHIITTNSIYSWENFKGFVSEEETTMMFKSVDSPQRAQYLTNSPERAYESMISTLKKLPWYMPQYITIRQRHAIYEATYKMMEKLVSIIQRNDKDLRLTPQLLNRMVAAAMSCPGFTVEQKDNIACLVNMGGERIAGYNQPRFADLWRHQYALGPKPGVPLDVLEFYIALIREETTRAVEQAHIGRKHELQQKLAETNGYWGYFWCEVDYPSGAAFDNMTLADAAAREYAAIEKILRRAVEGGEPPSY